MALPYKVETLDDVPEEAHALYEEAEGGYRLPVEGVETPDQVRGLKTALEKLKAEREELREVAKRYEDVDPDEYQKLRREAAKREEEKAKAEGRWDELREKLKQEHQQELQEREERLRERDRVIEKMAVENQLLQSLDKLQFATPEYREAAEAMFYRRGPEVKWEDGKPVGVFKDELHGPKPIAEAVTEWAESKAAEPFLSGPDVSGGGAKGGGSGEAGAPKKNRSEMSTTEKVQYIKEHGEEAFSALPM